MSSTVGQVVDVACPRKSYDVGRRARPRRTASGVTLGEAARDQLVGPLGDDARRVGVGRAAVRRVVLEAAVARRVVRRRDHDAVGQARPDDRSLPRLARRIACETAGVGRVAVAVVDEHGHVVGDEHLERGGPRRLGEPVGVAADEQRPVVPLLAAVVADRLRRRQDVGLVERGLQARAAVPAGAERDLLVDVLGVRDAGVVGGDEVRRRRRGHSGSAGCRPVLSGSVVHGLAGPPGPWPAPSARPRPRSRAPGRPPRRRRSPRPAGR